MTTADLLISQGAVGDKDHLVLLNEMRRFLSHDSTGVRGFDRMPREWPELNKLVSSGGIIPSKSVEARAVVEAWHQETRDLTLILSRMTETFVIQKLSRRHLTDPVARLKDDMALLCESKQLEVSLAIPDAAAPIEVIVDLARRTVDVGMTLRAPEDRQSAKARLNWLLRQIRTDAILDAHIRFFWPGRSPQTQFQIAELRENPGVIGEGKDRLAPTSFHVFQSKAFGARFAQQTAFIDDIEKLIPSFYDNFGSELSAWQKPAPKFKPGRDDASDVATEAIADGADSFEA